METRILSADTHKNLTAVQLITSDADTFDYIPLSRAMELNHIQLKEINEDGSVNNIFVINSSDKFVFIMDGDIIEGAKQNRVFNTSILLAPGTKSNLPVSCVEQGRWNRRTSNFSYSDYFSPHKLRSSKNKSVSRSLEHNKSFSSDQMGVWNEVNNYSEKFDVFSETTSLSDVYEKKKKSFETALKKFKINENANGLALFLEGQFFSIDVFNRHDVYAVYFQRLIKGLLFDIDPRVKKVNVNAAELKYRTLEILDKMETTEKKSFRGAGVGEESRFGDESFTGAMLTYDNNLIHLNVLKTER